MPSPLPRKSLLWTLLALVAFCAIVALTVRRTARVYHNPGKQTIEFGLCDFHNAVYFPGLAFSRGENPYSPDYAARYPVNREMSPYSPLLLPLAAPLGNLPLRAAEILWFSLNLLLTLVFAWLLVSLVGKRPTPAVVLAVGTLILLSRAGHSNLILGQVTLPLVIATVAAVKYARSQPGRAGVALAITTIKPTFGIPLALLMLCRRDFRAVAVGVTLGGVGAGLAAGWLYLHHDTQLLASFQASHDAIVVDEDVDPTSAWMRTDLLSVVARFADVTPDAKAELAFMLLLLAPAGLALSRLADRDTPSPGADLSAALIYTAIPICIYHLVYDLLVLLPVVAALLLAPNPPWTRMPLFLRGLLLVLLVIPVMNYLATWSIMERLSIEGQLREAVVSFNAVALTTAHLILCGYAALQASRQRLESAPPASGKLS